MKQLKALEILKLMSKGILDFDYKEDCNEAIKELEEFKIKSSLNHGKLLSLEIENRTLKTLLDRATKSEESLTLEIEASENRSCENCKNAYYQQFTSDLDDDVYSCDEFETNFINVNDSARPKDFYCNKWKQR